MASTLTNSIASRQWALVWKLWKRQGFGKGSGKNKRKGKGKGSGQLAIKDKEEEEKDEKEQDEDAMTPRNKIASAQNHLEEALGKASSTLQFLQSKSK